ncbi:MAG TPA: nucleotide exchange factor GrpE [Patescibacteria group bacterium]
MVKQKTTSKVQSQEAQLQQQLAEAQEREKRALADYQNIIRRNQEERLRLTKAVTQEVVGRLVEPLHHLNLAAQQLNDPGLDMVVTQLWQKLHEMGLQEIDVLGKPFDVETMEVVEKKGEGTTVTQVMTPGYVLNGEVIQHARVVVG